MGGKKEEKIRKIKVENNQNNNFKVTEEYIERYSRLLQKARDEMSKAIIGQEKVVNGLLRGLLSNGNVLVEGVPGIAKTLIIRTLAKVTGCDFKRIQFTADLLPTDIIGIMAYQKEKGFYVVKGPIFTNFVLADEINRAPPKTQSAMLEAMQEKQVSIGNTTFNLEEPFFVMATQNPIESLGTYPLPEAQVDRFIFKLKVDYPSMEEERKILNKNITTRSFNSLNIKPVISKKDIIDMQKITRNIYASDDIEKYIVHIVNATRFPKKYDIKLGKYIEWGGSPRASISLYIASKAYAFMEKRKFVLPSDVKNIAHDALRHRIIVNYEGQAEGITSDKIIDEILKKIPVP